MKGFAKQSPIARKTAKLSFRVKEKRSEILGVKSKTEHLKFHFFF